MIFNHLKEANRNGVLRSNSLGKALLDFSEQPGITEENVLAEIEVMFIAGNKIVAQLPY